MGTCQQQERGPKVGTRTNGFFPVIFLTLIVFISVAALTLTDAITKDKIELAKEDEIARMLITLFPEMDGFTYDEQNDLYIPLAEQQPLGRAFMAEQSGYSGVISILVGLEPDTTLRGIRIIFQQETPGLGAKIVESFFLQQFPGLAVDDIELTKKGGKVDAITGATTSSSAVVEGVRKAILDKLNQLGRET